MTACALLAPPDRSRLSMKSSFYYYSDGKDRPLDALRGPIANDIGLTADERCELFPLKPQQQFVDQSCRPKPRLKPLQVHPRVLPPV
jgi:hypothetical protein